MSDSDARLKVTADTTGAVGPVDDLTKAQQRTGEAGKKASQDLGEGYAKASAAVDKFAAQADSGGRGAGKSLALATIEVGKLEAQIAALKAQGRPTAQLEAGLDVLKGKLAGGTEALGKFKAASADAADATRKATQRAGEFSGSVTDVTGTLKTLSPALGNAIDKYSILAAKAFVAVKALDLGATALKEVAIATGSYNGSTADAIDHAGRFTKALASFDFATAIKETGQFIGSMHTLTQATDKSTVALGNLADAAGADKFAGALKVQKDLVEGHKEEVDALNVKAQALSREIETQQAAGEVQKFVRDAIQETLDAYAKAGVEVDAKLASQAASLGIVASAQKAVATGAEALSETTSAAAEARASAEEAATARELAAMDARKAKMAEIEQAIVSAQERLTAALAKGAPIDTSVDSSGLADDLAGVKAQIEELQDQPLTGPENEAKLDGLKAKARELTGELHGLNQVFTVTSENFLTEAESADAASAAYDLHIAMLQRAEEAQNQYVDSQKITRETADKNTASLQAMEKAAGDAGGGFTDLGATTDSVADSAAAMVPEVDKAAASIGALADASKAAAEKDPLESLHTGAVAANAEFEKMFAWLVKIKVAASEVSI